MIRKLLCLLLLLVSLPCAVLGERTFYLTIDDTPSQRTGEMLDLLQEAGVPATFFVVGRPAKYDESCWENIRRIEAEGHTLACHAYNHSRQGLATPEQLEREVRLFNAAMCEILGHDYTASVFRFPYGSTNAFYKRSVKQRVSQLGMLYLDWNASNGDGVKTFPSDDAMLSYALSTLPAEGDVVMLVHDNTQRTLRVLPRILAHCREQGYTFARLEADTDLSRCVRLSHGAAPVLKDAGAGVNP
jgi:peptidoglycan/xylan/chitin deacetylase (PgdA/CDA1 family)